jgi:hypothetical protein
MKNYTLIVLFNLVPLFIYAQNKNEQVTKTTDLKTGISVITLESKELTKDLTYVLTKVIDKKNDNKTSYFVKVTMLDPFKKTLNSDLTCSTEFEDGLFIDNKQTKEYSGWFKGTFTLEINRPENAIAKNIKHVLLKGEKIKLYHIEPKEQEIFKNQMARIVQEQI